MNLARITETYSPEINGVALTLGHLVTALARGGHEITVIRPRQRAEKSTAALLFNGPVTQHLRPGLPIPGSASSQLLTPRSQLQSP